MNRCVVLFAVLVLCGAFCGHAAGSSDAGSSENAAGPAAAAQKPATVVDALGREMSLAHSPEHVICSGPGCLRLLTYLEAEDRVVAVDDMEGRRARFDARPYALANPQFAELPLFGEFRGYDNPELIAALAPQPQVIFKTFSTMGTDPAELQRKTGIPVVVLEYGDLLAYREDFYASLRVMAAVMDRERRAEEVISFFEEGIADLKRRSAGIPEAERRTCYVAGIAYRGPQGMQSTEPMYPPFMFVNADNVAYDPSKSVSELQHADMAKEQIVAWDPDVLFIDASTVQSDAQASALYELAHDPAYTELSAVRKGEVHGVLPYNWYTGNCGSILADAYFVGKVLYPGRFEDVEPAEKADEIYRFLVGKAVFQRMKEAFGDLPFERITF